MEGASAAYDRVGDQECWTGTSRWSSPDAHSGRTALESETPTIPCVKSTELARSPLASEPPPSLPWCVESGDGLEAMSTIGLWTALETGALPPETRVWREGMECWTPACQVRELRWTLSRPNPLVEEPTAPGEPGAADLVSVALTPAEIGAVAQRTAAGAAPVSEPPPASTRERRSELPTLMSGLNPQSRKAAAPISLELPASFPTVQELVALVGGSSAEATESPAQRGSRVSGASLAALCTAPASGADASGPARPAPASGVRRIVSRVSRMVFSREAASVAAGSAVALLAIGFALRVEQPSGASLTGHGARGAGVEILLPIAAAAELPVRVAVAAEAQGGAPGAKREAQAAAAPTQTHDAADASGPARPDLAVPETAAAAAATSAGPAPLAPRCEEPGQRRHRRGTAERQARPRGHATGAARAKSR